LEEWKVIFGEKQDVKMEGVKSLLGNLLDMEIL